MRIYSIVDKTRLYNTWFDLIIKSKVTKHFLSAKHNSRKDQVALAIKRQCKPYWNYDIRRLD
jgi:hypothetical protein